ncbi:small multidrug resistance pump [Yoonia tamlensis]|uniref:Small multidrug resistance pump n=2 Tax=Yoonia tamlensis TaxID=390270 RepID=A0A1I6G7R0_9RHOB|nr:small multidrug resistance pump [Yoonia tamlensis]
MRLVEIFLHLEEICADSRRRLRYPCAMPAHYIHLILAIVTETIGTSALQASAQFTRLWPSVIVVVSYAASFYLLALALKVMPVGILYAIWSGLGIVLIAGIGYAVFGQKLDLPAVFGISLILLGIIVIHLFSNTSTH